MFWWGQMSTSWWKEQCPARGPGLTHVHSARCPGEHSAFQCCECGEMARPNVIDPTPEPEDTRPQETHLYIWTIAGKCQRCQRPPNQHIAYRRADDLAPCTVDHNSIKTAFLIDDAGARWTECPICQVQVEPRMVSGAGPSGPDNGPGRDGMTERLKKRLGFLRWMWERSEP